MMKARFFRRNYNNIVKTPAHHNQSDQLCLTAKIIREREHMRPDVVESGLNHTVVVKHGFTY